MFRKAQTNSCVCGQTFPESHAYLKHTRTCEAANARSEKASAIGVSKLAQRLELKEKRKKDRADAINRAISTEVETVPLLERLKRRLSAGKEHQRGSNKRGRMSNQDSVSTDTLTSRRFQDFLPEGVSRLLSQYRNTTSASSPPPTSSPSIDPVPDAPARLPRIRLLMPKWKTAVNRFGIFREYRAHPGPSFIPDENVDLDHFVLQPPPGRQEPELTSEVELYSLPSIRNPVRRLPAPTVTPPPPTTGSQHPTNSKAAQAKLQDLILHPRFFSKDLLGFNSDKLGRDHRPIDIPSSSKDLPSPSTVFNVEGFHHRKLVDVIRTSLANPSTMAQVHLEPYKSLWQRPGSSSILRIYDEVYTSDAMLKAHEDLQRQPQEPGCNLERVVLSLLFASDATHPTNFGQAKLWPLYMAFGNISKYERCKPKSGLMEHVAYFPSLPDHVRDEIQRRFSKAASKPVITHCNRELMHAIWTIILDDEFIEAWKHGIVLMCADGIKRRFYPRIFTYSADYPEKVLLATIRNLGDCPCPRCLIRKRDIYKIGTTADQEHRKSRARTDDEARQRRVDLARGFVYGEQRVPVNSVAVENLLKERSEVPTRNAFSNRLGHLGFDYHSMFVTDWLHEWDIGEESYFEQHVVCILYSCKNGSDLIDEFNKRFRDVPPFGRDTIRKFYRNVSDFKGFAARDYEDVLQCMIPVVEGLLEDPHNTDICNLLYVMADLMSLAKLRLHTDTTLSGLEAAITQYGRLIRKFATKTCPKFETAETPREYEARARRTARKAAKVAPVAIAPPNTPRVDAASEQCQRNPDPGKAPKAFNLHRFKLHALGDVPTSIRAFGSLEGYSTMRSELEHRNAKTWYKRTNKTQTSTRQITTLEAISRRLQSINSAVNKILTTAERHLKRPEEPPKPFSRYEMASSTRKKLLASSLLRDHPGDPAVKYFWERLRDYFISQLRGVRYDGEDTTYTNAERHQLHIKNDSLYQHTHLRINYTSYDVRRAQDSISLRTACRDIMVAANDAKYSHPFWYARVLGIWHAFVAEEESGNVKEWKRVDVLWVRWFGFQPGTAGRRNNVRLDRVGFVPLEDDGAFGFIHPEEVIRASHIIPAFAHGREKSTIGHSFVQEPMGDYNYYYIMRFVDRDMYMRYRGDGIGHLDPLVRAPEPTEHSAPSVNSPTESSDAEEEWDDEMEALSLSEEGSSTDESDSSSMISEGSRDGDSEAESDG
ncbi:hypothetical protein FRC01_006874 [Tulasnella sp. 417]|nr:hypothetical protein FRC01_006874 [Tulasnella sp. 417]